MAVNTTAPTDQVSPCLHLSVYHPDNAVGNIFRHLPLQERRDYPCHTVLTVGRLDTCLLRLHYQRASRMQLQFEAVRRRQQPTWQQQEQQQAGSELDVELSFEVKNLSKTMELRVNDQRLGHLERVALPPRSLLIFGNFQLGCTVEAGESVDSFEVLCEVATMPLRQETGADDSHFCTPMMETGGGGNCGGDNGNGSGGDGVALASPRGLSSGIGVSVASSDDSGSYSRGACGGGGGDSVGDSGGACGREEERVGQKVEDCRASVASIAVNHRRMPTENEEKDFARC
ncbi:TRAF-interacting protein with FHA domain-containing protein A [Petromyzon marinus]|uniref:TRAF-interacting protein with FHA domain-containing protein A n=1 Tax=Petromyzon marinus TaxID=7757 RepID=UPI003F6E9F71